MVHAFPEADVPVVQLSIHAQRSFESHLELGARLAPLRERGVLIVGSGNVVHNLRQIDWEQPEEGFDWARRFDEDARALLTGDPADTPRLRSHPDYARSAPTPDHFIPLLYIAGLASAARRPLELLVDGYAFGSLSMAAYTLDAPAPAGRRDAAPSAGVPDPSILPPEDTNL
jgi:4,5-DOPA dioxygenase extradiol